MEQQQHAQDRRPQQRVVYNDQDVQTFRRCLASYMSGDYSTALAEIRTLRTGRYAEIVHLQLNELIIKFYHQRCVNADEFVADLNDAMTKAYGMNFEKSRVRDLTQVTHLYNYALIQFYLMRYSQALSVMKTVEKYFDTLEDALVRDCSFLLIELYLVQHKIPEALAVITYLEEEFDEQTGLRIHLPEDLRLEALLFDENSQLFRPLPGFRGKLQLYKVKVVNRLRVLGVGKKGLVKESKGLLTTHGVMNLQPVYLKSQAEYNISNYGKAIKLLNHIPPSNASPTLAGGDCLPVLHYNNLACAHSAMGKATIATVYFNKAMEENTKVMAALPIPPTQNGLADYNQVPLQSVGASRCPELMYNLGTQLLLAGQPVQAFTLLVEASHIYHQNPRLWLRLAECCIAKHKNDVIDPLHRRKPTRYMIKGFVGSGKFRKMLLSPVLLPYQKQLSQRKVPPTTELKKDPSEPSLTIEFARMCLINALAAVNRHLSRGLGTQEKFLEDMYSIAPSGISTKQEMLNLKAYILINLAFVSNAMWDYLGGIDYARQAEAFPEVPGVIRFLISAYASEGLMRINRLADAGYYLSVSYIQNVFRQMNADLDKEGQVNMLHPSQTAAALNSAGASTFPPGTSSSRSSEDLSNNGSDEQLNLYDRPGAVIKSLLHVPNDYLRRRPLFARNLLGYNHAVWLAMNGDLDASYAIGEKLRSSETNADSITRARATQLCIYIRFRQGRGVEATKLITNECPEWKDRLTKDFDVDEVKLRQLRETQGIPWPLD
ncbi:CCR4-NOT transcription complex subunit 10 [Hypsibius exemplaris]|uniref:CCR4-NOT transcription complex subunit 10 n=1 Tax=Hypsibius exemplaris TaxID=2072580 RepID=A0A9X6NHI8_HYPEX|nr:CCR4-NOT transcription complex subunit 10 [Hypsibius exemplaris]